MTQKQSVAQRVEAQENVYERAIDIIEQLIECHEEGTCPATDVGREVVTMLRAALAADAVPVAGTVRFPPLPDALPGSDFPVYAPHQMLEYARKFLAANNPTQPTSAGDAEAMAAKFHETYEQMAPSFGYETRAETKVFDADSPNGRLMVAVCEVLIAPQPATVAAGEAANRAVGLVLLDVALMLAQQLFDQIEKLEPLMQPAPTAQAVHVAWQYSKIEKRIQELMVQIGFPDSHSIASAFKQFANELHAEYAAPQPATVAAGETYMRDAYTGAREDLAIWQRRALEAERYLREEKTTSSRLASEINAANGPTRMGEPAQPAPTAQAELSDDAKDAARYRWLRDSDDAFDALWLHTYRLIDADADQFDKAIDAALARHTGEGEKHDE